MNTGNDVGKEEPDETSTGTPINNNLIEIQLPAHGYVPETFNVSGINGIPGPYPVVVWRAHQVDFLNHGPVNADGTWTVTVSMPSGVEEMEIYASQPNNRNPDNYRRVHRYLTTLTKPRSNSVLRADEVVFGGTRFPDTRVWVYEDRVLLAYLGDVLPERTWEVRPTEALSSGAHTVKAQWKVGNLTGTSVTPDLTFTVVGTLIITGPTTDQEMNFKVTGTKGIVGAKVEVKADWGVESFGDDIVKAGGNWSVNVRMKKAGPINLVAEQTYQNVTSPRSEYKAFKIKPPKVVSIYVSHPRPGTVKFSGAGYEEATVDVHITGNDAPLGSDVVRNGEWSVEWSDQLPGQHQIDIRQRIADGSGWIYSDWSVNRTVTIPVPVPTLSVQVGEDRKPVFSGTGDAWPGQPGRIEVRREDETEPAVPIVDVNTTNRTWSSAATEAWNPGTYHVQAWQLFNDLPSDPTELQRFTINAPLPTVSVSEDGLTPHFSGTCLNGAQVNLGFDGDTGTPYEATLNGTTWTFTRTEPFIPGSYTARVTQSIGGQTSNPATQAFTVEALQPVITYPINEEVDHNPTITGTGGIAGAVMTVFDYLTDTPLGHAPVSGNDWSVPLENLGFGSHRVYVMQTKDGSPSEPSEAVSFEVILFPPTIDHPQPGDRMPRIAVIDGYARTASGFDVAWVELWLDGADEPLTTVRANRLGYWSYDAHLPVGEYVLRARQRFVEEVSDFGPDHPITVVPPIPVIESPALRQHIGATATISGHGYAGDWVEVAWSDAPDTVLGRTQVQANRTWSLTLPIDRPAGEHPWIVRQECDDYRSDWSEAHLVLLLSGAPAFTAPEAGHWFAGTALFEGTGETDKRIELAYWFDSRQVVSQDDLVSDDTWTASPDAPLLPGPHWLKARQDDSDWADSLRFEVARVEDSRGR